MEPTRVDTNNEVHHLLLLKKQTAKSQIEEKDKKEV